MYLLNMFYLLYNFWKMKSEEGKDDKDFGKLLLFSRSVMSDSLWPRGLQFTRFPWPSLSPELGRTHVHWVSDTIQPSHPLLSPPSPAFYISHHQGFFQWVSSSYQMVKLLELQLQHQSFQWIFRIDFL